MFKDRKTHNKKVSTRRAKLGGDKAFRMATDWSGLRLAFVAAFFGLVWLALWSRAFYVQVVDGDRLAAMGARQHVGTEFVEGERGRILDRNGRILATSVAFRSVFARPYEIVDVDAASQALAKPLGESAATLRKRLTAKGKFVWLAREIDDAAAATVRAAGLPGVYLTTEYARQYPGKQLAGQLLGFAGIDEDGLEGLESAFDEYLRGSGMRLVVQRDASGRLLNMDGADVSPLNKGGDVVLTLDAHIQDLSEAALARAVQDFGGKWGGALVIDVPTGDILAWAEYPRFNPNAYRESSPGLWRNRIAVDALEPGSTIKPFVVAAAMQEHVCDADSLYYCENGKWRVADATIGDTHPHKWLPVSKIVRYSSNIGAAKIGMALGADTYRSYLSRLGFGDRSNLPLPGESKGILRPVNEWTKVDLATAAFGQGMAVTTLQLAQAYLTLASEGVRKPLRLVVSPEQERGAAVRVFEPHVARRMLGMLEDAVEEDGTGVQARIKGLAVGGKTGTAQKACKKGGYGDKFVSSFVGFVPAQEPQYLILVLVDEPEKAHYGGVVAAPAFKEVAVGTLAYMGRMPDLRPSYLAGEEKTYEGGTKRIARRDDVRQDTGAPVGKDTGGVPAVVGLSLRRALEAFARFGIVPDVRGEGMEVTAQKPAPGSVFPGQDKECVIWLDGADGEKHAAHDVRGT
ncbi:MAG: penicillin-binding transpeptidase domain-containing protein [Desulfovibrionaceae bacterium]